MSQGFALDKILLTLVVSSLIISSKDQRILLSLQKQLSQGNFLTEGQGNLLVKIFKENSNVISILISNLKELLDAPTWSRSFRVIPKIRKITFGKEEKDWIKVEFTFDKRLKNKMSALIPSLENSTFSDGSRDYMFSLTEKNVYLLVNEFINDEFDIDQEILDFYYEISEIVKNNETKFDIFSIKDEAYKKIIQDSVGRIDKDNLLVLHDKKIAYQYEISEDFDDRSLTSLIAKRKKSKIFVDSKDVDLSEIIKSLKELDRFPLLVIFEGHNSKINKSSLEILKKSLEDNQLSETVGIYFRFDKEDDTAEFNKAISELGFNKNLTSDTVIAGIANNKLPKFMLKMGWKPKSIISFTNNFKNNKSAVYFSDVDLVIFYNDKKPFGEDINALV